VTPKVSHLNAVKRIFRYLKEKPYLGLWYPKDSPFDLVAYSDIDYAGCYLRNVVIEIVVLNILSDALPITTNGQTATGKEYSNPFMAGVNTPRSDEDRLKLMELMVFLLQKGFWNTASVKRSGDITRLQALVDKKKVVLSENVIYEILQLDDADGVEDVAETVAHDAISSSPSHDIPSPSQEPSSPPQQPQSSPQAPPQGADFPTHTQQVLDKLEIIKLQARVKRLEKANKVKSLKLRSLRKVKSLKLMSLRKVEASRRIESSDDMEDVFNQGRMIDDMDKDEWIKLVKDADFAKTEGRHAAEQAEKQAEIYNLDLNHSSKVL
nr:uncharacterized mitochondrial protein AtMg00810-like [Tanacetum cinerariifolium]